MTHIKLVVPNLQWGSAKGDTFKGFKLKLKLKCQVKVKAMAQDNTKMLLNTVFFAPNSKGLKKKSHSFGFEEGSKNNLFQIMEGQVIWWPCRQSGSMHSIV